GPGAPQPPAGAGALRGGLARRRPPRRGRPGADRAGPREGRPGRSRPALARKDRAPGNGKVGAPPPALRATSTSKWRRHAPLRHERVAVVSRRVEGLLHGPKTDPADQVPQRALLVVN